MIENIKQTLQLTPEELKQPTILKQKDSVFYLLLNTKANTFSASFTRSIHKQLDIIETNPGSTALVTISLSKMFSGGMDLREMEKLPTEEQAHTLTEFVRLIGRVTVLPFPTFCLVRRGAAAGGCIFAFAHDNVYVGGQANFSVK
jgi:Delta3-Delta2-enoyl-CoA isomerase